MASPNSNQIYYSFLHEKDAEVKDETYFDSQKFDWVPLIENNWEVIRKEVLDFIKKDEEILKPYFASEMMNAPNKWNAFSFYFWGLRVSKRAVSSCPKTIDLLKTIPNMVSASISVMEPHSEIKPHYGDSNAIYRCHLGLIVPGVLPKCGFRVGYEDQSWEEGRLLMFNDAAYHKAWNNTKGRRIVLLFDVIRPQYSGQSKWVCSKVRGGVLWQIVSKKTGIFKTRKNGFTKLVGMLFAVVVYFLGFPLYRKSALLK